MTRYKTLINKETGEYGNIGFGGINDYPYPLSYWSSPTIKIQEIEKGYGFNLSFYELKTVVVLTEEEYERLDKLKAENQRLRDIMRY